MFAFQAREAPKSKANTRGVPLGPSQDQIVRLGRPIGSPGQRGHQGDPEALHEDSAFRGPPSKGDADLYGAALEVDQCPGGVRRLL